LEKKEKTKKSLPTQTHAGGGGDETNKKTKQRVTKFPKVRLERTSRVSPYQTNVTLENVCLISSGKSTVQQNKTNKNKKQKNNKRRRTMVSNQATKTNKSQQTNKKTKTNQKTNIQETINITVKKNTKKSLTTTMQRIESRAT
jgi:hypothetical protein